MRFSDFHDNWSYRKLIEIATKVTEKNTDLAFEEILTNSAEHGIINQRDYFDHAIANMDNINGYYVVRNEDFVYNPNNIDVYVDYFGKQVCVKAGELKTI